MPHFALRVNKGDAEEVRTYLLDSGLFDRSRLIQRHDNYIELPVTDDKIEIDPHIDFEIVNQESPNPNPPKLNFQYVRERLIEEFGSRAGGFEGGWELMGDILVVNLSEDLMEVRFRVGDMLMEIFPRARSVVHRSAIAETLRRPRAEVIAGDNNTMTTHKENGCLFRMDPLKVMFSGGNVEERRRMAHISGPEETVVDMFAGIGQFTVPMGIHSRPGSIIAIEKRQTTFGFLKENVKLNGLSNVTPVLGDCRDRAPKGIADRVLMGYIFDMPKFLPTALEALMEKGGVLHYHDLVAKKDLERHGEEVIEIIRDLGWNAEIEFGKLIKSYSPSKWHAIYDIRTKA